MESLFKRWMAVLLGFNISNVRGILSSGQVLLILSGISSQVFMHSLQNTWSQGVWSGSTTTSWQMEHINSPARSIWSFSGNLSIFQPIVKLLGALLGVSSWFLLICTFFLMIYNLETKIGYGLHKESKLYRVFFWRGFRYILSYQAVCDYTRDESNIYI